MTTKFSSTTMNTQNGYTLEISVNKIRNNIIHYHIRETDCYVGVPVIGGDNVNINVTECGFLEVIYRNGRKYRVLRSSMPEKEILSHFRAEKDFLSGKYRLYRNDLQPDNPILSTIIDDKQVTIDEDTGDIKICPLFPSDNDTNKAPQDGH